MGRFYKTHRRWITDKPVKKAEVVSAIEEKKVEVSKKEEPVIEKVQKEEPVIEKAPVAAEEAPVEEAKPAEAMIIEKTETEEGIYERANKALVELHKQFADETIIVVTHGQFARNLIAAHFNCNYHEVATFVNAEIRMLNIQ